MKRVWVKKRNETEKVAVGIASGAVAAETESPVTAAKIEAIATEEAAVVAVTAAVRQIEIADGVGRHGVAVVTVAAGVEILDEVGGERDLSVLTSHYI